MQVKKVQKELEKMTDRQLVKKILEHKLEDDLIFPILQERGIKEFIVPHLGEIYTISEHARKSLDQTKLKTDLGEKFNEYVKETTVKEHICRKLNRVR